MSSQSQSRSRSRSPYDKRDRYSRSPSPRRHSGSRYPNQGYDNRQNNYRGYQTRNYNNRGYYNPNYRGRGNYHNRFHRGRGNYRNQQPWYNKYQNRDRHNNRRSRSYDRSRSRSYSRSYSRSRSRSYSRDRDGSRSPRRRHSRSPDKYDRENRSKEQEHKMPKMEKEEEAGEPLPPGEEPINDRKQVKRTAGKSRWDSPGHEEEDNAGKMKTKKEEKFDESAKWNKTFQTVDKNAQNEEEKMLKKKIKKEKSDLKKRAKELMEKEKHDRMVARSRSSSSSSGSPWSPLNKDASQKVKQENVPPNVSQGYQPMQQPQFANIQKQVANNFGFQQPQQQQTPPQANQQNKGVAMQAGMVNPIDQMQVIGPNGKPMKLVTVNIPGPDGNMIQAMQLQPITQAAPASPVPPPKPAHTTQVTTMFPAAQSTPKPVTNPYSMLDDFKPKESTATVQQQKHPTLPQHTEVIRTRLFPKPATSWITESAKKPEREEYKPKSMEKPPQNPMETFSIKSMLKGDGSKNFDERQSKEGSNRQSASTYSNSPANHGQYESQRQRDDYNQQQSSNSSGYMSQQNRWKQSPDDFSSSQRDKSGGYKNTFAMSGGDQQMQMRSNQQSQQQQRQTEQQQQRKTEQQQQMPQSRQPLQVQMKASSDHELTPYDEEEEPIDSKKMKKEAKKKKKKNKKKEKQMMEAEESPKSKKKKKRSMDEEMIVAETSKKSKNDQLVRVIDEDLPLQHIRGIVPRSKKPSGKMLFEHINFDDLLRNAMIRNANAEDAFAVSLFGSEQQTSVEFEASIDINKKSVRKFKVKVEGSREVEHATKITLNIRMSSKEEPKQTPVKKQKVSVNLASLSKLEEFEEKYERKQPSPSRSSRSPSNKGSLPRAYSISDKPNRREVMQPSAKYSPFENESRSPRGRSEDEGDLRQTIDKRTRSRRDSRSYSRSASRSRSRSSSRGRSVERDRRNYNQHYNNNRGNYHHNNRGRGRGYNNRGWHNNNYRGRGNYRGNWNHYNRGGYNRGNYQNYNRQRRDSDRDGNDRYRRHSSADSSPDRSYRKTDDYSKDRIEDNQGNSQYQNKPESNMQQEKPKHSPKQWKHDLFEEHEMKTEG